jgi:hypothetical protein
VTAAPDNLSDTIDALRAALEAEQLARREAEAMVAHLKRLMTSWTMLRIWRLGWR